MLNKSLLGQLNLANERSHSGPRVATGLAHFSRRKRKKKNQEKTTQNDA